LFVGFVVTLFFEPLKSVISSLLNVLVATELAPLLGTLGYGFAMAVLSTFAWNFFLGAGIQIVTGLLGPEITKFILFGRALLIGLIYGATNENIARVLDYNALSYVCLALVVLTEFLAYSIATYGGVNVGKVLMKGVDGTLAQKILDALKGPSLSTYRNMKSEIKAQLRASLNLCPIIATLLMFAAALEIWLILG
jgi:uncharacterized membrane protein